MLLNPLSTSSSFEDPLLPFFLGSGIVDTLLDLVAGCDLGGDGGAESLRLEDALSAMMKTRKE